VSSLTIGEFFKEKGLRTTVVSYDCIESIILDEGVIHCAIIAHSIYCCCPPGF